MDTKVTTIGTLSITPSGDLMPLFKKKRIDFDFWTRAHVHYQEQFNTNRKLAKQYKDMGHKVLADDFYAWSLSDYLKKKYVEARIVAALKEGGLVS